MKNLIFISIILILIITGNIFTAVFLALIMYLMNKNKT